MRGLLANMKNYKDYKFQSPKTPSSPPNNLRHAQEPLLLQQQSLQAPLEIVATEALSPGK